MFSEHWRSPTRNSMSTAAPSPSATPSGAPAPSSPRRPSTSSADAAAAMPLSPCASAAAWAQRAGSRQAPPAPRPRSSHSWMPVELLSQSGDEGSSVGPIGRDLRVEQEAVVAADDEPRQPQLSQPRDSDVHPVLLSLGRG